MLTRITLAFNYLIGFKVSPLPPPHNLSTFPIISSPVVLVLFLIFPPSDLPFLTSHLPAWPTCFPYHTPHSHWIMVFHFSFFFSLSTFFTYPCHCRWPEKSTIRERYRDIEREREKKKEKREKEGSYIWSFASLNFLFSLT